MKDNRHIYHYFKVVGKQPFIFSLSSLAEICTHHLKNCGAALGSRPELRGFNPSNLPGQSDPDGDAK